MLGSSPRGTGRACSVLSKGVKPASEPSTAVSPSVPDARPPAHSSPSHRVRRSSSRCPGTGTLQGSRGSLPRRCCPAQPLRACALALLPLRAGGPHLREGKGLLGAKLPRWPQRDGGCRTRTGVLLGAGLQQGDRGSASPRPLRRASQELGAWSSALCQPVAPGTGTKGHSTDPARPPCPPPVHRPFPGCCDGSQHNEPQRSSGPAAVPQDTSPASPTRPGLLGWGAGLQGMGMGVGGAGGVAGSPRPSRRACSGAELGLSARRSTVGVSACGQGRGGDVVMEGRTGVRASGGEEWGSLATWFPWAQPQHPPPHVQPLPVLPTLPPGRGLPRRPPPSPSSSAEIIMALFAAGRSQRCGRVQQSLWLAPAWGAAAPRPSPARPCAL